MLFLFLGWLQTLLMIYCEELQYICFGEIILNHKVFISIWETIGMFEAWFVWFCGENKRILFCCCSARQELEMMFEEAKFEDGDTEQLTYKDDDFHRFLGG